MPGLIILMLCVLRRLIWVELCLTLVKVVAVVRPAIRVLKVWRIRPGVKLLIVTGHAWLEVLLRVMWWSLSRVMRWLQATIRLPPRSTARLLIP